MDTRRTVLLIEDNPGDVDLVKEYLDLADVGSYAVVSVPRIVDALAMLGSRRFDVIVLDLSLPDSSGIASVTEIRLLTRDIPIVVLTGADNEDLALACIEAGAQDYIAKSELQPVVLRRAIGYAMGRQHEQQLRELSETLAKYRALTSAASSTSITATSAGVGPLRERHNGDFAQLVDGYVSLLHSYLNQLVQKTEKPRTEMERMVTRIGDLGGGPRDLLDVHVTALDDASKSARDERARALALEGRLLALEMMGYLVDYYRTGARRRFNG